MTVKFKGDVAASIAAYKAITQKRGHGFFDPPAKSGSEQLKDQKNLQNGTTQAERLSRVEEADNYIQSAFKVFSLAASNINHPDHLKARKLLIEEFGSSEGKVMEHLREGVYTMFEISGNKARNLGYEAAILKPYPFENPIDAHRHHAFNLLMRAKWDAEGYTGDADLISDFTLLYPGSIDYSQKLGSLPVSTPKTLNPKLLDIVQR